MGTASTEILESLQDDQENLYKAIASWQSEIFTPSESRRKKGKILKYDITSNVWIPCKITSELVWAKQKKFPWLPAHICEVFDSHRTMYMSVRRTTTTTDQQYHVFHCIVEKKVQKMSPRRRQGTSQVPVVSFL